MNDRWRPISEHEIRLLRRNGLTESGHLSYGLHVFNSDTKLPYAAISYMCGPPPDDNVIYVHNEEFKVRKNCLDALQQIELQDEYYVIWLDCVCINQADLNEKSRQVQNMGRIYRDAHAVLACVGSEDDLPDAQLLREATITLKGLSNFDQVMNYGRFKHWRWLESLQQDQVTALTRALNRLSALPYWKRLWIVQEINLGRKVQLYVGNVCLEWRGVIAIWSALERSRTESLERLEYNSFTSLISGEDRKLWAPKYDLPDALLAYQHYECSIPHDRMYALREIVNWSQALGPIEPNYNLDPFKLAQDVLRHLRAWQCEGSAFRESQHLRFACDLLRALAVDYSNPLVSERLIELRRAPDVPSDNSLSADTIEHEQKYHSDLSGCLDHHSIQLSSHRVTQLGRDDNGRFTIASGDPTAGYPLEPSLHPADFEETSVDLTSNEDEHDPTKLMPLYDRGVVAGWLPKHAQNGDWLASVGSASRDPGLLMRPVSGKAVFQIVGIFMPQHGAFREYSRFLAKTAELVLHFDPMNLLMFALQSLPYYPYAKTQANISEGLLQLCRSRVTRSAFSSYGVVHEKTAPIHQSSKRSV